MSAISAILALGPQTVKTIAERAELSESRVRELIKKEPGVKSEKVGSAPATFWTETPSGVEAMLGEGDGPSCPLCGSKEAQNPAGEEGSFLGACNTCSSCGETYNAITGKVLRDNPAAKPKRVPLNPQYKIAAKVEAMEKEGGSVVFDRGARQWLVTSKAGELHRLTAKQFAGLTPETIVQLK